MKHQERTAQQKELVLATQEKFKQDDRRIQEILEYINDNLNEHLSVQKIAKQFFISREYLCSYFKKHTGETLFSYIRRQRLNYAVYLLENTDKKVIDICELSGFNAMSTFLSDFKNEFGMTPSQMRKDKTIS